MGFCGSNFSTGLTLRFGSLVNGITNTARKAVTLILSFALFPERNHLTTQHIFGALIFFSGLVVRTVTKDPLSSGAATLKSKTHEDEIMLLTVNLDNESSTESLDTLVKNEENDIIVAVK